MGNQPKTPSRQRARSEAKTPLTPSTTSGMGGGVIRKGGVESRLDVVTLDYVAPPKHEVKRSKSTPAVVSLLF